MDSIERAREAAALMIHMRALCRQREEARAAEAKKEIRVEAVQASDGITVSAPCGEDVVAANDALLQMRRNMRQMRRGRL